MASTKETFPIANIPGRPVYDPTRIHSPNEYSLLGGLDRNYELQENIPISGVREDLRAYSPFKISLVPPIVYGNLPEQDSIFSGIGDKLRQIGQGALDLFLFAFGIDESEIDSLLSQDYNLGAGGNASFEEDIETNDAASIAVREATKEWEESVHDATCKCTNGNSAGNCPSPSTLRIDGYIRSPQGAGLTGSKLYTCDTVANENGAQEWCGFFVVYCYGAAGLKPDIKKRLYSASGSKNWADKTGRLVSPSDIKSGDILLIGTSPGPPTHIGLAIEDANYPTSVRTIEGNTFGEFPDGNKYDGVGKRTRPFTGAGAVLHGIRLKSEDFVDGFSARSPTDEANENQVAVGVAAQVERVSDEAGLGVGEGEGPLQSRGYGPLPYTIKNIQTLDVASHYYDSWQEAKDARTRGILQNLGAGDSWGLDARSKVESFVALGKKSLAGGVTEPALADRVVAADVALQLDAILKTPALTLLVNPLSLSISYEKIQQYTNHTRMGYIYEAWGEQQPKLSISGQTGAFIAGAGASDEEHTRTKSPSGVQFACKRDSAAYQNLMNLFTMYKNNGYIFDSVFGSKSPLFVGALSIEYDGWVYIGHMENFNYGFDQKETQNGRVQFDFEFTVSQMYDTSQPVEVVQEMANPNGGRLLQTGRSETLSEFSSTFFSGGTATSPPPLIPEASLPGGVVSVPPSSLGVEVPEDSQEEEPVVYWDPINGGTFPEGGVSIDQISGSMAQAEAYQQEPVETRNIKIYDVV